MEHCDDKNYGALWWHGHGTLWWQELWSIVMTRSWNNLMTSIMEHCDDTVMEHWADFEHEGPQTRECVGLSNNPWPTAGEKTGTSILQPLEIEFCQYPKWTCKQILLQSLWSVWDLDFVLVRPKQRSKSKHPGTSDPQNCEVVNVCHCKLLNLWYSHMAAIETHKKKAMGFLQERWQTQI